MFAKKKWFRDQKGQALLIVVLAMVVALTVGLAVATRAIINIRNTSDQVNSQKALSAAEAGAEQAIRENTQPGNSIQNYFQTSGSSNKTSYDTSVNSAGGSGSFLLNGSAEVGANDAIYVWVTPYSSDPATAFTNTWSGKLTVYWGGSGKNCNSAALEVSVIYGSKDSPKLKRYAYDPCSNRQLSNHFDYSDVNSDNTFPQNNIFYNTQIDLTSYPVLLVRINPIYNATTIGVLGSASLASQGKIITSKGTSDTNTTRKITVFEGYPEVPSVFFPYNFFQP